MGQTTFDRAVEALQLLLRTFFYQSYSLAVASPHMYTSITRGESATPAS